MRLIETPLAGAFVLEPAPIADGRGFFVSGFHADEFATLNKSLHRLERFWTDQILYRL